MLDLRIDISAYDRKIAGKLIDGLTYVIHKMIAVVFFFLFLFCYWALSFCTTSLNSRARKQTDK